jgi:hypothetical protein
MPLTKPQLVHVKRLLKQAFDLGIDAMRLLQGGGDDAAAARAKDLADHIELEIEYLDQLLAGQP